MKTWVMVSLALLIVGCSRKKAAMAPPAQPVVLTRPSAAPVPQQRRTVRRSPQGNAAADAVTPPVLEALKTPQERRESLDRIKTSVAKAQANLVALRSRQLTGDDAKALGRVDSFIRQARAAEQANDLTSARQYAQRAELLSDDLLSRN